MLVMAIELYGSIPYKSMSSFNLKLYLKLFQSELDTLSVKVKINVSGLKIMCMLPF